MDINTLNAENSLNMLNKKLFLYNLAETNKFELNKFISFKSIENGHIIKGVFNKFKIPKGSRNLSSLLIKGTNCEIEIISNNKLNYIINE
jgi:hypothetical protein